VLLLHTPRACTIPPMKCTTCFSKVNKKSATFVSRTYCETADTLYILVTIVVAVVVVSEQICSLGILRERRFANPQITHQDTIHIFVFTALLFPNYTLRLKKLPSHPLCIVSLLTPKCLEPKLFPIARSSILHIAWVFVGISQGGLAAFGWFDRRWVCLLILLLQTERLFHALCKLDVP